jgi:NAD(P)-dependent dehydrogenase (short-subunit alcohol dehydrogenase family)
MTGQELSGKTAIITGGTGGLGKAVTRTLVDAGAFCIVTFQAQAEADDLAASLGAGSRSVAFRKADVLDEGSVDAVTRSVLDDRGQIDILAHLVGGYVGGKDVQELSLEEWRRLFDLNVTSAFLSIRAVLPAMQARDYGRIVVVGARSAVRPSPGVSAYTASKAALLVLIGSVAEENHARDLTANAVLPSIIDTPANRQAMPKAKHDSWPKSEQVADVIQFLVGAQSALINGAAIPVFGKA